MIEKLKSLKDKLSAMAQAKLDAEADRIIAKASRKKKQKVGETLKIKGKKNEKKRIKK